MVKNNGKTKSNQGTVLRGLSPLYDKTGDSMNVVEVQSLQINYDEVRAVDNISFTLEKGKIYGFVGPNGAGKTSTIKALAGVLEPTQGRIIHNGHDLDVEREQALVRVGYMPDFPPVYENLRVWEYLDVFASAYGIEESKRSAHVSTWLEKADLSTKRTAFIKGLSRGMRQRLVLAKTLLSNPDILLLDEPASGLDPIARKQMRDLLKGACDGGAAILISSHILSELSEFVDAVIILEKGRVVLDGTIDDIRQKIGGGQRVTVRFTNEAEGLPVYERLLRECGIEDDRITRDRSNFLVHFSDSDGTDSARGFLQKLLASGVGILECSIKKDDIEDIFFKVGAKEVA